MGSSTTFRYVGNHLPVDTASYARRFDFHLRMKTNTQFRQSFKWFSA